MYLGKEGRYVTDGRWKLYDQGVSLRSENYYRDGQLFDLQNDPHEKSPLFSENDTPESAKMREVAQKYLDQHPLPERLLSNAGIG